MKSHRKTENPHARSDEQLLIAGLAHDNFGCNQNKALIYSSIKVESILPTTKYFAFKENEQLFIM